MNAALLVEVEAQVAANAAARARGEAESALQRWRRLGLDGEPAAPDDAPFAAEGLETLVERHPAVIAATAALTSVERARRSLGAGAWSPRIGIGAKHHAGLGDHALVLGLELPLANARAVNDDRRAATARVAAAQAQRDGERLRILDGLATARAELVSAGDAVAGLLPLLQRSQTAVESAVRAHADGALGDLDLIATRRAALTVRRLVSEAQVEVWKATIALRQASGTLLPSME